MKKSIHVLALNIIYLMLQYLLVRFPLHFVFQNKDWVLFLVVIAFVLVTIGYRFLSSLSLCLTSSLYIIGFCIAQLLQTTSYDPSGGILSDWWIIWLISIVVGFVIIVVIDRLIFKSK